MVDNKKYKCVESFQIPNDNTGKDRLISVGEMFVFVEYFQHHSIRRVILTNHAA